MRTKSRSIGMITYFFTAEDTGPVPGKGQGHWMPDSLPGGAGVVKALLWYLVSLGAAVGLAAL